jgi:DNA mismatch repair ATPase MutS
MYEEYIQKWRSYSTSYGSQTCLFYMVGKFYELYDILDKQTGEGQTNVKQAVESLGITLTVREGDGPKGENCLFAGFPEQSLQKFAGMLTRDGWTVVVCDQEKSSAGKVVDRPVARIFSPGTHIELAGAEAPYLAGLWLQEIEGSAPSYAAAVLDLTTGHLVSFESKAHGTRLRCGPPMNWSIFSKFILHVKQLFGGVELQSPNRRKHRFNAGAD